MESFEELSLPPELIETLAIEGIEVPTSLQVHAVPVVSRGNNLVAVAGPGAGVLVATVVPLLTRLEPGDNRPVCLVLTSTPDRASHLAEALGRFAITTPHRVAALEGDFALPETAGFLVGTAEGIHERISSGHLSIEQVAAVVVDDAAGLEQAGALDAVETVLDGVPADAQRVMSALPWSDRLEALVGKHFSRSVKVPPGAESSGGSPHRGSVQAATVEGSGDDTVLIAVREALEGEAAHAIVYVRTEDRAADVGDRLTLHGFLAGRCGDPDTPVWMAVDALEARAALDETEAKVALISLDVPADEDELDRRHGGGRGGLVLVAPRELAHLRAIAHRAGYGVVDRRFDPRGPQGSIGRLYRDVEALIADGDAEVHQTALEPLFERHGVAKVAGALLALLRARKGPAPVPTAGTPGGGMVKLFISIGSKDGVGPGDLMGAIAGESGVKGDAIGKIDLRETFSLVEVRSDVAQKIIKSMNGTTIRGRSTRVDLDRSERSGGGGGGASRGAPRRGGPGGSKDGPKRGPGGASRGGSKGGPRRSGPADRGRPKRD